MELTKHKCQNERVPHWFETTHISEKFHKIMEKKSRKKSFFFLDNMKYIERVENVW